MNPNQGIKIIQISDTHLFKKEQLLFGVNTNLALNKVMNYIQNDSRDAYAIFLTGDLSQDETIESYEIIADLLEPLGKPIFWIPGNHDSVTKMHSVFDKKTNFFRQNILLTPFWDFIFLDTQFNGKDSGYLSDKELYLIHSELNKNRTKPIALIMHHHPIKVKTPLIDNYILENKNIFFQTIYSSKTNLIICGHVHNDYSLKHNEIHIETCPATCFQFKKGTIHLEIEKKIGYKVYFFSKDNYVAESKYWAN